MTLDKLGAGENYSIGYSVQTPLDASGQLTNIINVTSGSDSKTAADVKEIVVKDFNPGDYVLPNNPRIAKSMMDITRNGSSDRMTLVQDGDRWEYQDTHVNDNFQYKIVIYTEPAEDLGQAGDIYMVDTLPDGMAYDLNVPLRVSYTSHTPNRTPNRTGGFDSFDNEITRRDMADSVDGQIFKLQIPTSVLARINQENGNQHVGEFKGNYITITYDINLVDQDEWDRDNLIEKTYKNSAVVESEVSAPTEATHTLTTYKNQEPAPVMSKAGHVNAENETIDYQIVINPDAVKLTSSPGDNLIKLVDRISPQNTEAGGVQFNVIMDSVKLLEYLGDADQPVAPGARQFIPVDLKQSANGLEMMVPDQQAMVLTYQVDVARNGYTGPIIISNTADLAGYTSTSGQQKLSEVDSNAGMDGSFQAIEIRKIDAENSGKPLSKDMLLTDVKYDIDAYKNSSWQNKMKSISPDSNTKVVDIDFTRFNAKDVYGTDFTKNTLYKITETQAPSGYRLSASPQYFVWTDQNVDPAVVYQNIEKPADVSQNEITFLQKTGETSFTFENEKIVITPYTKTQPEPGELTIIKGEKIWQGDQNYPGARPNSVVIQVVDTSTQKTVAEQTVTAADGWVYQFELPATDSAGNDIDYQLVEKLDPNSNYQSQEDKLTYQWEIGVWSDQHGKNVNLTPINVINTYTPPATTTSVKVTKEWNHGHNPVSNYPNEITVNLLADGVKVDQAVIQADSNGKWEYEFTNLPFEQNGKLINYTVTEEAVSNYSTVVDHSYQHAKITNTYIPETIPVSGSKIWDDSNNQDGKRPESVTVKLFKDGADTGETAAMSESTGWTYSFDNLPKYYNGALVNYSVQEIMDSNIPYNSVVTKTQEGYDITNSYTPETISVSGTKTWDDANNQDGKRPESITVELLADGVKIDEKVVSENTNWEYSFDNLPRYKNGKEIVYTIGEELVLGYASHVNGYDIRNYYEPETITVSGVKTWADSDDQDGKRPDSIVVRLMNGNQEVASRVVDKASNWSYSFKDLPKYSAGVEIQYSVTEDSVTGYTTTVDGYNITNSYTPETISVSGTKTWDDSNNQDGKRPASIVVNLLADGNQADQIVVTENTNWKYSFDNLPRYNNGKEIVYTIGEDSVPGYTTTVDGYNITNTHTLGTVSVSGVKTWDDGNDQDGIRPTSITVNLLADGSQVDKLTFTATDNWKYSFDNLPRYNNGQEIVYTVSEDPVASYTTSIYGFNITNTHIPEVTRISGVKTWDDADNQDGKRPDAIKLNLYADGDLVYNIELTSSNNWNYEITNLPKYKGGNLIVYTITEEPVEGYTSLVEGFNVINTYKPETTNTPPTEPEEGVEPEKTLIPSPDEPKPDEPESTQPDKSTPIPMEKEIVSDPVDVPGPDPITKEDSAKPETIPVNDKVPDTKDSDTKNVTLPATGELSRKTPLLILWIALTIVLANYMCQGRKLKM